MGHNLSFLKKPAVRSVEEAQALFAADHPDAYVGPLDGAFIDEIGRETALAEHYLTAEDPAGASPKAHGGRAPKGKR